MRIASWLFLGGLAASFSPPVFAKSYVSATYYVRLSSLKLSDGNLVPGFSDNRFQYTADVSNKIVSVTVTATAKNSKSKIKVNGITVLSGKASPPIDLKVGVNKVYVQVIYKSKKKTYTIAVTRAKTGTDNALLVSLITEAGPLFPEFDSKILAYSVSIPAGTKTVRVTPTAADPNAIIKVNGATVRSGSSSGAIHVSGDRSIVSIVVLAPDRFTKNTYSVHFLIPKPSSEKITVTGELQDVNGKPIGDPQPLDVKVRVKLFDRVNGGKDVYQEDFSKVTIDKGDFVVRLGEGTTSDDLIKVIRKNKDLFVEFRIAALGDSFEGVQPLSPRLPLTSVPSAFKLVNDWKSTDWEQVERE